jgi:hypothetical protein
MSADPAAPAVKRCPVCKRTLRVSEFHFSAASRDGLYRRCKSCNSRIVRDWKREQRRLLDAYKATFPAPGKDGPR